MIALARMKRILEVNVRDRYAVVEPGAWGDYDASAVGGSVGECDHHGRPVVSSVESAG